jgi:hypothetical protein
MASEDEIECLGSGSVGNVPSVGGPTAFELKMTCSLSPSGCLWHFLARTRVELSDSVAHRSSYLR